ncbi:MAG: UDP-N-acetylmuramate-L-alanine ligase [Candidatus Uhrbacteria bacterium GW2011_GWA2_53_10]|uniref:UDP-N-acetylmuramate--L-alanine ligase n=1 Tax=Candidatus Uhrbacteria bacterium GW2011_GWA2_53_10 TaxID=1618980 RepID=A0A0G1XLV1_9BACT|nr:MAG: UDP-N-acetylmuramate-L-alanine ligase [Candidatus Uhrbacteria bacterium GW2011_GWA2_53_10]HBF66840.1 UDP-N-acetylmuramate--L-alanine ligase [Candidatus Magasanikbacteria bacterium]
MNFKGKNITAAHCVGIGGIGVSAVAKLLAAAGVRVSGSDIEESFIIEELRARGVAVVLGHRAENVPSDAQLLVYTPAAGENNPERVRARELGVLQMSYPEFLGELSRSYKTIAVSGTHGKSTTTAMIGLILEAAGFDPTVIVGSRVPAFPDGNLRVGNSEWLVVEACEHQGNMRHISASVAVVTAIEKDHLDYYRDLAHIVAAFQEFIDVARVDGTVVFNADDERCAGLALGARQGVEFGIEHEATWVARDRAVRNKKQEFVVYNNRENCGLWSLAVPGIFNVRNALAAGAAAFVVGVPVGVIRDTLAKFTGIWRRFELVGVMPGVGAHVVSDYGHHPTAVRVTLEAAREQYPGHRIVLVFQPHQHNRTKNLFDDFVEALCGADVLIGVEIYDVAGREEERDQSVSTLTLVEAVEKRVQRNGYEGPEPEAVVYAAGLNEAEELAREYAREDDVILVMGAGDVWQVAGRLVRP